VDVRIEPAVVDVETSDTSNLLVIVLGLCSFLLTIMLLSFVLFLVFKRVRRVNNIKADLTAVVTQGLMSSTKNNIHSEHPDLTSGYSGSGSGVLIRLLETKFLALLCFTTDVFFFLPRGF